MPKAVVEAQPSGTVRLDRARDDAQFEVVRLEGDTLLVTAYDDLIGGTVYLYGFSTADLGFMGGQCLVLDDIVQQAAISGVIVPIDGAEEQQVVVQGCGVNVPVDAHGGFFAEANPGPCTLFAVRRDGSLSVRSDPLDLDLRPGDEVAVELALPTWRAASVGVRFTLDDEGAVLVDALRPGAVAGASDLLLGDEVVAIDGEGVEGLALWEVIDLALGPDGTEVVYTVVRDGRELELTLERWIED